MPIRNDHTEEVKAEMQNAVTRALEAAGLQVESLAKLELENSPRRVDTGLLRNSITHAMSGKSAAISTYSSDDGSKTGNYSGTAPTATGSEQAVYIGSNVEYAAFVHEGHTMPNGGHVSPNRFLRNAVERNSDQIKAIMEHELREG